MLDYFGNKLKERSLKKFECDHFHKIGLLDNIFNLMLLFHLEEAPLNVVVGYAQLNWEKISA